MDQNALAEALGRSPAWVTKYKHRGMPVHDADEARRWCAANLRAKVADGREVSVSQPAPPMSPPAALSGPPPEYQVSRARREAADADKAEMEAAKMRGELVPVTAIRAEFSKAIAAVRDNMLNLPGRLGPVLAAQADARQVQATLDAEIRAALGRLAD